MVAIEWTKKLDTFSCKMYNYHRCFAKTQKQTDAAKRYLLKPDTRFAKTQKATESFLQGYVLVIRTVTRVFWRIKFQLSKKFCQSKSKYILGKATISASFSVCSAIMEDWLIKMDWNVLCIWRYFVAIFYRILFFLSGLYLCTF